MKCHCGCREINERESAVTGRITPANTVPVTGRIEVPLHLTHASREWAHLVMDGKTYRMMVGDTLTVEVSLST